MIVNAFLTMVALPTGSNRQIDVCLSQVYLAARTCMADVIDRRGAMVCASSVHARTGFPGHPAHAAKGGTRALVRQLAVDFGPPVRVDAVLPGSIETRI